MAVAANPGDLHNRRPAYRISAQIPPSKSAAFDVVGRSSTEGELPERSTWERENKFEKRRRRDNGSPHVYCRIARTPSFPEEETTLAALYSTCLPLDFSTVTYKKLE
jgi:hypothetical protein